MARFFVPVLVIGVLAHRFGLIDTPAGLAVLGIAWIAAALSLFLGIVALMAIWRLGIDGVGAAFFGILMSVPTLAVPLYFALLLTQTPQINDVTTDTLDPPAFVSVAGLRPPGANPVAYSGRRAAELQQAYYPDVRTYRPGVGVEDAYDAALAVAQLRGWRVVSKSAPADEGAQGLIEAVATTLIMGFKDDIIIRITPSPAGALIDVRSASRYGLHDFGANARRVQAYLFAVREEISPTAGGQK